MRVLLRVPVLVGRSFVDRFASAAEIGLVQKKSILGAD
jgi:hypothetical protein